MRIDIKQPERFAAVFETVTGTVLHRPISGIATDSRECNEGDLYIALTGERTDGHGFLPAVMEQGAAAALVSKKKQRIESSTNRSGKPAVFHWKNRPGMAPEV